MLRGNQALMNIVSNDVKIASEKHVKGCFTDERDNALACRFFYYGHLIGYRYDKCLTELSKEFYLSETVIGQRLMNRQGFIKSLRIEGTTGKDLLTRYPHFNWRHL